MGMLDVWVAKPGEACRVDDHDWIVRVEDAHGNPFVWAGNSYAALPAPHAHWAGTIPPGTYVISATRKAKPGEPNIADATIAEVCCDKVTCVLLWVRLKPRREEPPPGDKDKYEDKGPDDPKHRGDNPKYERDHDYKKPNASGQKRQR
jgi:hypothetical protein